MPYQINNVERGNTDAFNVLVAYEDVAGGKRAWELLERMTKALPSEDSGWLRCATWKFNDGATPVRIEMAAEQATRADLIIIAAQEREELPAVLEEWVRLWFLKKEGSPCALVALLERPESHTDHSQGIHSYFEKVAQNGELAFFADAGLGRLDGAVEVAPQVDDVSERDVAWPPDPSHHLRGPRPEVDLN